MTSARNIVSILLIIPSGIFADFFGRKLSIAIAITMEIAGFTLLFVSNSFGLALVGNLLVGGYFAFLNGADIALVYDSLKMNSKEGSFKSVQVIISAITIFALSVASFVGGLVASSHGLRFVILLNVLSYIMALVFCLLLKEPPKESDFKNTNYLLHFKESLKILLDHTNLFIVSLLFAALSFVSDASQTFFQGYLNQAGLDIKYFGVVNAILLFCAGLISYIVIFRHNDKFLKKNLVLNIILVVIQFIVLSLVLNVYVGVIVVCIGQIGKGTFNVLSKDYSNKNISSKYRATIISMQGFLASMMAIFLNPAFGLISDSKGVQMGYLSLAIFLMLIGLISMLYSRLKNKKKPNYI